MKKVPGLNIYDADKFYYVLAFYSENRESLDSWLETFGETHADIIEYYDHNTRRENISRKFYSTIIISLSKYDENLFDFENELQEAGVIDVQFVFRIMTKSDLVIYDSNQYTRYLGPKHYIAAIVKNYHDFDCEMYEYYTDLLQRVSSLVDSETINKVINLDSFADKNEVLRDYYELTNPEERIYMLMSDINYIKFFFGGH